MPSFSDITDVSVINYSFDIDRSRAPLFPVAQFGDDITGRELNLVENCPVGSEETNPQPSEQLRPMKIQTGASTEAATASYTNDHLTLPLEIPK